MSILEVFKWIFQESLRELFKVKSHETTPPKSPSIEDQSAISEKQVEEVLFQSALLVHVTCQFAVCILSVRTYNYIFNVYSPRYVFK